MVSRLLTSKWASKFPKNRPSTSPVKLVLLALFISLLSAPNFYTPAKAIGTNPTPVCSGAYCTITFAAINDVYEWTVPAGITSITVDVRGASGGIGGNGSADGKRGGYGAKLTGDIAVTPGAILKILAGKQGTHNTVYDNQYVNSNGFTGKGGGGSGGGASYIALKSPITPYVVAGGGGGGPGNCCGNSSVGGREGRNATVPANGTTSSNGTNSTQPGQTGFGAGGTNGNGGGSSGSSNSAGGGAGWLGNGGKSSYQTAVAPLLSTGSGAGGTVAASNNIASANGGFGGGGQASHGSGGGGGGYSGGGGANSSSHWQAGGGGGSYTIATSPSNTVLSSEGDGSVAITYLNAPTPTTFSTTQTSPTKSASLKVKLH